MKSTTTTTLASLIDKMKTRTQGGGQAVLPRRRAITVDAELGFESFQAGVHPAADLAFARTREWAYGIGRREEDDHACPGLGLLLFSTEQGAKTAPDRHPDAAGFGCGKTHLLVAAATYLSKLYWVTQNEMGEDTQSRRFTCSVIRTVDFFGRLRDIYSENGSTAAYFRSLTRGPLFLDDVGKEYRRAESKEWAAAQYYSLIDHCYTHRLPLMLTSNLDPDELVDRLGGAAASRIAEMCGPNARYVVDLSAAPDFRVIQNR